MEGKSMTTFRTPADLEAAQARLADFESRLSKLAPVWIEEAFTATIGADLPDALAALRQAFQRIEEFESALAKSNGRATYACVEKGSERAAMTDVKDAREYKARKENKPFNSDNWLAEQCAKLSYELTRFKEAIANRPDWETLWSEQTERAETAERELDEARRMLAEADATVAGLIGYPVAVMLPNAAIARHRSRIGEKKIERPVNDPTLHELYDVWKDSGNSPWCKP
jgi:hypothetical protein